MHQESSCNKPIERPENSRKASRLVLDANLIDVCESLFELSRVAFPLTCWAYPKEKVNGFFALITYIVIKSFRERFVDSAHLLNFELIDLEVFKFHVCFVSSIASRFVCIIFILVPLRIWTILFVRI